MLAAIPIPDDTPVIVTGAALPPTNVGLDEIILTTDDLDRVAGGRLENALTAIPDVQTFRRADGDSVHPTASGMTTRGLGGNAAGRVLVVVDGVPQNDPFGGWVDWPALATDRIGTVGIARGGGETRWGSGAIAGLVQIDSIVPEDGKSVFASLEAGSRTSLNAAAHSIIGSKRSYLLIGGQFRRSDGFIPIVSRDRGPADIRSPYQQWNAGGRGAILLGSDIELQGGAQFFGDRRQRGLEGTQNRTRGNDLSVRLVGKGSRPFELGLYRQDRVFSSQFSATDVGREESRLVLDQYEVPARGWGARGEWHFIQNPTFSARVGADIRSGDGVTHERYLYVDDVPTRERKAGGRYTIIGVHTELSGRFRGLEWTASGRLDHWSLDDGRLIERQIGGDVLAESAFPRRTGWNAGGRVSLGARLGGVRFEAALNHSWRLPTLNELYRPYRVGADAFAANPELKPETVTGAELTARAGSAEGWAGRMTVFAERLDNAIANVTLDQGPGVFPGVGFVAAGGTYAQRQNVASLTSAGIEVEANWRSGPLRLGASAAWLRARVHATGAAAALDGKRPAQVPAFSLAASIGWTAPEGASVGLGVRYLSSAFEDDLNRERLKPALTIDASTSWPISDGLSLVGSIENLLDARVETGIASDGAVERATPRTVWLGIRFAR